METLSKKEAEVQRGDKHWSLVGDSCPLPNLTWLDSAPRCGQTGCRGQRARPGPGTISLSARLEPRG